MSERYVIVRTESAGVFAELLEAIEILDVTPAGRRSIEETPTWSA